MICKVACVQVLWVAHFSPITNYRRANAFISAPKGSFGMCPRPTNNGLTLSSNLIYALEWLFTRTSLSRGKEGSNRQPYDLSPWLEAAILHSAVKQRQLRSPAAFTSGKKAHLCSIFPSLLLKSIPPSFITSFRATTGNYQF